MNAYRIASRMASTSATALALIMSGAVIARAQTGSNRPPASVPSSADKDVLIKARLIGVFDEQSGEPLEGADVLDVRSGTFVRTTSTGTAALSFLREGVSIVRVQKVGFAPQTMFVAVSQADTLPITVVLQRVTQLPLMTTRDSTRVYLNPSLRAFEERRARGRGSFISDAELRKADGRLLGETLLGRIPGITVREIRLARWGKGTVLSKENGTGAGVLIGGSARCYPDVYLDHVKMPEFAPGLGPDLGLISVSTLAGAEYHDIATLPMDFGMSKSGCGAVLLWSRER